ncbi:MAG: dihydropteroate synthase [Bacteroidetes bacterium]|nr:MAG: dihydropteroate synthase [Bacteroidota bacterium]
MSKISVEDTNYSPNQLLRFGEKLLDLSVPKIMGIINCTPDSFYQESRFSKYDEIHREVERKINDGADIIDLGAVSTRPGAAEVSEQEELDRILPLVEQIHLHFPEVILSIDSFRARIAEACLNAGADMINDISASQFDSELIEVVSRHQCPYVLMHSRGTPQNMQELCEYDNLYVDLCLFFSEKKHLLRKHGIQDIILDPGFGFAKTLEQNYELLKMLDRFHFLELPIMVGLSRKSMIYKLLESSPEEALNGTTVLHTIALQQGAQILRVHDVREARETIRLMHQLQ